MAKSSALNDELFAAIDKGSKVAVAKLLAAGADPKAISTDDDRNTTLTRALNEEIEKASAPVVELLLRAGADPNLPSGAGYAPICCAAEYADPKITELLLSFGAKVDAVDPQRRTALVVAAVRAHVAVMKLLIAAGANVDFQSADDDGNTVLTRALDPNEVMKPAIKVVQTLLEAGANPSTPNKGGWTPLHYAASFPDPKFIDLLVAAGADVKATRATDVYAVDVAELQGHHRVMKRLIAHGSLTAAESAAQHMQAVWQRIDLWCKKNAPSYSAGLAEAKAATPRAIAKIERTLKIKLPIEFRAYLTLYGGGGGRVRFYGYDALSAEQIISRWTGLDELYQAGTFKNNAPRQLDEKRQHIKWAWWHPGWVPFAEDGGGNLYCLDLDPAENGLRGQVIKWELHDGPIGPFARSFDLFLDLYLSEMKAGDLEYNDGCLSQK